MMTTQLDDRPPVPACARVDVSYHRHTFHGVAKD